MKDYLAGIAVFAGMFGSVAVLSNLFGLPDAPGLFETLFTVLMAGVFIIPVVAGQTIHEPKGYTQKCLNS